MRRIKLPRHSLIYQEYEDEKPTNLSEEIINEVNVDKEPSCCIMLTLVKDKLDVFVDIDPGVDPIMVGALVGSIATGEVIGAVLTEVTNCMIADDREEEMDTLRESIKYRIEQHRDKTYEEMGRNRPVVEPIGAIRSQITMYQQPATAE